MRVKVSEPFTDGCRTDRLFFNCHSLKIVLHCIASVYQEIPSLQITTTFNSRLLRMISIVVRLAHKKIVNSFDVIR